MVTKFILIMMCVRQVIMLHTFNFYSAPCLLRPDKTENK